MEYGLCLDIMEESGGKRGKKEETDDEKNHQGKNKNFFILTYKWEWPLCPAIMVLMPMPPV